jgi:hypothetical protein
MTLSDWQNAESLDERTTLEGEEQCKIAHMQGAGLRGVAVIIPNDCLPGIRELVELRSSVGINMDNCYLFPSRNGSLDHIKSSQAFDDVCKATGSTMRSTDFKHCTYAMYARR